MSSSGLSGPPPGLGVRAASVPPPMARQDSQGYSTSVPPMAGAPPMKPPSRPATSMSNASDLDDLLGPAAPRKAGAKKARKGRYVDVMANAK
jgi:COPII coat assembly protein SEC16